MSRNYFIGIGGTGARVAEALIHLCAAGLGPAELFLCLVDPDEGNGNLSRTKRLLVKYQAVRQSLGDRLSEVRFFGTKIVSPEPTVWTIFGQKDSPTLGSYISFATLQRQSPELAELAEVLFSDEERETQLNEGFRGHPSIGSVVMASPRSNEEPWKSFWTDVEKVSGEGEARVFLAGSIFGGTGAAGVPTFGQANMLKMHPNAKLGEGKSKITLGGCLVLPYFSFESAAEADANEMCVNWSDFPLATRAALQYYEECYGMAKLAYDDIYLVGDSGKDDVGTFSAGSSRQENRPHYIELVSALTALDFWSASYRGDRGAQAFMAARSTETIDWSTLPISRDSSKITPLQGNLRHWMICFTAFAYTLATYGKEKLSEGLSGEDPTDAWWKENFADGQKKGRAAEASPTAPGQLAIIEGVVDFGLQYLRWLDGMSESSVADLIDTSKILDDREWSAKEPVPRQQRPAALGSIAGSDDPPLFDTFVPFLLAQEKMDRGWRAADKFVNLFALAAAAFVDSKLNVPAPSDMR